MSLRQGAEVISIRRISLGGGYRYLIESVASNEAFGQVYLYRLLLREVSS